MPKRLPKRAAGAQPGEERVEWRDDGIYRVRLSEV